MPFFQTLGRRIGSNKGLTTLAALLLLGALDTIGRLSTGNSVMIWLMGPDWFGAITSSPWFAVAAISAALVCLWRIGTLGVKADTAARAAAAEAAEAALAKHDEGYQAALNAVEERLSARLQFTGLLSAAMATDKVLREPERLLAKADSVYRELMVLLPNLEDGRVCLPQSDEVHQRINNTVPLLNRAAELLGTAGIQLSPIRHTTPQPPATGTYDLRSTTPFDPETNRELLSRLRGAVTEIGDALAKVRAEIDNRRLKRDELVRRAEEVATPQIL